MPTFLVRTLAGSVHPVFADVGQSVMEALRAGGIDDLLAQCGGGLACATCHVQIDPAWLDRLPSMSEAEDALLDGSTHRSASSRLACQLPTTEALDGLALAVAEPD